MAKSVKDNIVQLFDDRAEEIPETPLGVVATVADRPVSATGGAAVDLTGKPRVVMVFGPGRSGKSSWLRWAVERSHAADGDPVLATVDASRPTLKRFFPGALSPRSAEGAMLWLEKLLGRLIETRKTAAIDFSADMSLVPLLSQVPDLQQMMVGAGVEPVALYLLTPRSDDLTVLKSMEDTGFRPAATGLILNLGTLPAGADAEQAFAQVRRHSVYRAAIGRGAVEVWMPKLHAAKAIEDRSASFLAAASNVVPAGMPALGIFDPGRTRDWLRQMDESFAPLASWLP